jgi:hypothetical protein
LYAAATLKFIRSTPQQVLRGIRGLSHERDLTIAADFFPIPGAGQAGDAGGRDSDGGGHGSGGGAAGGHGSAGGSSDGSAKKAVNLDAIPGGFKLSLTRYGQSAPVKQITGQVAYDIRSGNPFKKWVDDDFTLGSESISTRMTGCIATFVNNSFIIDVDDATNFVFEATGFDTNRDVKVSHEETL